MYPPAIRRITLNNAGIILGGDVTFRNIQLYFANAVRNAIIANGHSLTLDGVSNTSSNNISLFCGGVTDYCGSTVIPEAGDSIATDSFTLIVTSPMCICSTRCIDGNVNSECAACSAAGADLSVCIGERTEDAAVTIGGETTYVQTLPNAIAAVAGCTAEDEAKVTLLDNIDLGNSYVEITSGVFTLDLNGCSITGTHQDAALGIIGNTVSVTITDSGEGGTISGDSTGVWVCSSNITVNGGTISGAEVDLGIRSSSTGTYVLSLAEGTTEGATFPGGIRVDGITLSGILGAGASYWGVVDGNKTMLAVEDADTAITDKGDITIRAICDHSGSQHTTSVKVDETIHSYTCTECNNSTTENRPPPVAATCNTQAMCGLCGLGYGTVDLTNHDENVNYVNGCCPNGCYESATDSDSDGFYERSALLVRPRGQRRQSES